MDLGKQLRSVVAFINDENVVEDLDFSELIKEEKCLGTIWRFGSTQGQWHKNIMCQGTNGLTEQAVWGDAYVKRPVDDWGNSRNVRGLDDQGLHQHYTSAKIKGNINIGDICVHKHQRKIGLGSFRLCRVVRTFPDEDGLVCTAEVEVRPKNKRVPTLPYVSKILVKHIVMIRRLVKLLT